MLKFDTRNLVSICNLKFCMREKKNQIPVEELVADAIVVVEENVSELGGACTLEDVPVAVLVGVAKTRNCTKSKNQHHRIFVP